MSSSWIGKAKDGWKRTERFRAGLKAGLKTGTLVAGSVRAIGTAPVPDQPNFSRTDDTPIARRIEREGVTRLKDYGTYEVSRLADQQRQLVDDLPKRAAAHRTSRAVQADRSRGSSGRRSPGRAR
ncbi:hypothetical protein [Nocardioides kribbensis]|uniref:Uncharacterized protein n=1 Tax=Nocardioides kribbensis TaxID=305517 RepID=A0ABV1NTG3_9ACTN